MEEHWQPNGASHANGKISSTVSGWSCPLALELAPWQELHCLLVVLLSAAGPDPKAGNLKCGHPCSVLLGLQVSLQYEKEGAFHHTCGGTLIAPDWVLTAGHCISSLLTYRVVLGEYDRAVEEGPEQVIPVNPEGLFVHPEWNDKCVACGNDIALVKLSRSAQLGEEVQLARLPPAGDILPNGEPCYISGWGVSPT
ncbi:PREDICTED: proproteinase E-like [Dipodomys ordii]|uniref:Proproteinase E-like n=1 Tax=Dipodomys ordii TaxID=10020 RepID=A0A1S3GIA4_DIPOR|nr:PREDICTED: proproteinase E-like [Dipodomys ordii]